MRTSRPGPLAKRGPRTTKRGPVVLSKLVENHDPSASFKVREKLQALLNTENLPASARVTAARTLAEMDGLIGRHQTAPVTDTRPVSLLSRDELVTELERLRTLFGLGLVS
jgi:hypothetical protein